MTNDHNLQAKGVILSYFAVLEAKSEIPPLSWDDKLSISRFATTDLSTHADLNRVFQHRIDDLKLLSFLLFRTLDNSSVSSYQDKVISLSLSLIKSRLKSKGANPNDKMIMYLKNLITNEMIFGNDHAGIGKNGLACTLSLLTKS